MQTFLHLGSRRLLKVGGSFCLPIPGVYLKDMHTGKGTEFDIEMLDDKSIRIRPISSTSPTDQKIIAPEL